MSKLEIEVGPFHTSLEDRFCQFIKDFKHNDQSCPIAVVSPSSWMTNRLKELSVKALNGMAFNIHFWTFQHLAMDLYRESVPKDSTAISHTLFYEKLLLDVIDSHSDISMEFKTFAKNSIPTARAIYSAIRDMRDATIDPNILVEALRESKNNIRDPRGADSVIFTEFEQKKLNEIVKLYRAYCSRLKELRIHDPADVMMIAARVAPESKLLKDLRAIVWYGFYDVTQSQWDLVDAVSGTTNSLAFLPIQIDESRKVHPNFKYASIFYETFLVPAGKVTSIPTNSARASLGIENILFSEVAGQTKRNDSIRITSAAGTRDEVWACAKQILDIVSSGQASFSDLGVVVRNLERYTSFFQTIFDENNIPYRTSAGEHIIFSPIAKLVRLLFCLGDNDFNRRHVIELVSSPYFLTKASREEVIEWDHLTRALKIGRGEKLWIKRLKAGLRRKITLLTRSEEDTGKEEPEDGVKIDQDSIKRLLSCFTDLVASLSTIHTRGPWSYFAKRYEQLITTWLKISGDDPAYNVLSEIINLLYTIGSFDALARQTTVQEFKETFLQALEELALRKRTDNNGVTVVDAMAARGLRFKILFVLGLNEEVFPRVVSPEPFLSDEARKRIIDDLGYKMRRTYRLSQKKEGYDEERLLFTLLLQSADKEIRLSYQRADDKGRLLSPSIYLQWLRSILTNSKEQRVPRNTIARYKDPAFVGLLTPTETFVRTRGQSWKVGSLPRTTKSPVWKDGDEVVQTKFSSENPAWKDEVRGLLNVAEEDVIAWQNALKTINLWDGQPGAYDGIVGHLDLFWDTRMKKGFSPTSLETVSTCPYKYFAHKILGLASLVDPAEIPELSPAEEGNLYDSILTKLYSGSGKYGIARTLDRLPLVAKGVFRDYERKNFVLHPALWGATKTRIVEELALFVRHDLRALQGYIPRYFQKNYRAVLTLDVNGDKLPVSLYGIADRVDISEDKKVRIIDYKRSYQGDKYGDNIVNKALRLASLQPAIYLELVDQKLRPKGYKVENARFYFIKSFSRYDLETALVSKSVYPLRFFYRDINAGLDSKSDEFLRKLGGLVNLVKQGIFFIKPSSDYKGYCGYCDFSRICRRGHRPSRERSELSKVFRVLEGLQSTLRPPSPKEQGVLKVDHERSKKSDGK